MIYFKEKWCFVGNGLFISWIASCKFTHLWKPHFLPIVQVLLKSAVLLSAWMSNSHSSVNLMSCCLWKELRLCALCPHFVQTFQQGSGPNLQLVLHFSLTKLQGKYYFSFSFFFFPFFWEGWCVCDASAFVPWSLTPTSPWPVGYDRKDECQNL